MKLMAPIKLILIFAAATMGSLVNANDDDQEYKEHEEYGLEQAPAAVLAEHVLICKDWAMADGIEEAQLQSYVLQCVNDELQSQGYLQVGSVKL